jgi:hypothetical protein
MEPFIGMVTSSRGKLLLDGGRNEDLGRCAVALKSLLSAVRSGDAMQADSGLTGDADAEIQLFSNGLNTDRPGMCVAGRGGE